MLANGGLLKQVIAASFQTITRTTTSVAMVCEVPFTKKTPFVFSKKLLASTVKNDR